MKISLVIPAYNEEKYIGVCLKSVLQNGAGLFEVIVINNASSDRTEEIVKSFPSGTYPLRVVNELQKGLTKARQRGLSEMRGDIIAFIDADTMMPKGWIERIMKEFEKNDKLVCLSGPYRYYDLSLFSSLVNWSYWVFLAWPTYFITGYMAVGGNFVAKKSALETIGGFDETINFYGEDTDIAKRLSAEGKVKFMQRFYMYTSARRLKGEGFLITGYRYIINFLSVVWRKKPVTTEHVDIR
jgi:glycosyltransferase involved in cell wall biosynthesis